MLKKELTKAKPKLKPKLSQKERFLAYAKEIGVEEAGEEFERVMEAITKKGHKKP